MRGKRDCRSEKKRRDGKLGTKKREEREEELRKVGKNMVEMMEKKGGMIYVGEGTVYKSEGRKARERRRWQRRKGGWKN